MVLDFLRSVFSSNKVLKFDEVLIREYKKSDYFACRNIASICRVSFKTFFRVKFVAEFEGKVVGFFCGDFENEGSKIFVGYDLGVLPKFRNLGVASLLVNKIVEICLKNNVSRIEILAANSAVGFWRKKGFNFVHDDDELVLKFKTNDVKFNNSVLMELILN